VRYRRKKFTFAISSPDKFLLSLVTVIFSSAMHGMMLFTCFSCGKYCGICWVFRYVYQPSRTALPWSYFYLLAQYRFL